MACLIKVSSRGLFHHIDEFQLEVSQGDNIIGKGSFGVVRLALHKGSNRLYALKIIDLAAVESETELKIIQREVELHSQLDHPHIIKVWDALLQGQTLYMIMEAAEKGNLFYHQNTKVKFSQVEAFQYFYQTLMAVDHLHRKDIIHRDIKPQNLLLDHGLNIKLCDFGWCARDIHQKRTTFCGTYEYMAPEMLFKSEYDYRVDIWSVGVLLYELLHGHAPFRGRTLQQVRKEVQSGKYELSKSISQELKSLLQAILQSDPQKRPSISSIFQHSWIKMMRDSLNSILSRSDMTLSTVVPLRLAKVRTSDLVFAQQLPTELVSSQGGRKKTHRKAESMSHCPTEKKNIQINFEINNYGLVQNGKKLTGRCKTMTQESIKRLMMGSASSSLIKQKNIDLKKKKEEQKISSKPQPPTTTTSQSIQSLKTAVKKMRRQPVSRPKLVKMPREVKPTETRSKTELSQSLQAQLKKQSIDEAVSRLNKKYLQHVRQNSKN